MKNESEQFEDEVRRIARELWPVAEFGGAANVDGRQRDGIFETEDQIHCIECTLSRGRDKAREDAAKLDKLTKKLAQSKKFVRGWFITREEPTADQRDIFNQYQGRVICCSYDQFRSKLVNARAYLELRLRYPFGSVRDPASGSADYKLDYVPLDLTEITGAVRSVVEVANFLGTGERVVMTGDYGAGKSSTSREIFLTLMERFLSGKSPQFPVMLNLRDHHGQVDPVEALERHARSIGFMPPGSLVRGWRAGYCILLLDGFDEIASAGWAGQAKRLRELRYRSMELLRKILRDTPAGVGVMLTGRAHFFDSDTELRQAFSLTVSDHLRLQLAEFTPEQVEKFLKKKGWKSGVPEWLPTRPLLLAYLVREKLLDPKTLGPVAVTPAFGWDHLLDRISHREAEIEAGIDATTVRKLIERLASEARTTLDGVGPLSPEQIQHAFRTVCGYSPDDRGAVLLQRLPGLGGTSGEDGSRIFIDLDFVDVARAGDVLRFVASPFDPEIEANAWEAPLRELGVDVACLHAQQLGTKIGAVSAAMKVANDHGYNVLGTDLVALLVRLGGTYDEANLYFKEVVVPEFSVEGAGDLGRIEFQDCVFLRLDLPPDALPKSIPMFRRCHFGMVTGRTSKGDLPAGRFSECEFDEFEHAANTTSALLALPLPLATRVLLTVLKKLFVQKGMGRKDSALSRGLDTKGRSALPDVLDLLRKEGFVIRIKQGTDTVLLPAKGGDHRKRALEMLGGPIESRDSLVQATKML
jgi:hypothetical protein